MATTTLSAISAALSLVYAKELTTQINRVTVLPYLLPVTRGVGQSCNWTAEFTGAANASAVADGTARSASDADAEVERPAVLQWALYDKTSSVGRIAQAAAASNANPGSIGTVRGDLLMGRAVSQAFRLATGISQHLYSGNPAASPVQVAGAALAIDSSGTFAGIDPTTYTEWAATESTSALASVSFRTLDGFIQGIYDACGERPEFLTMPSAVWSEIKALYHDRPSYTKEILLARGGGIDGTTDRVAQVSGMQVIDHDGVPLVLDRHCTALTMYGWNTNYVEIQQLDEVRSQFQTAEQVEALFRSLASAGIRLPQKDMEGLAARSPGIAPGIEMLGNSGHSKEVNVFAMLQTSWKRRNAHGKHTFT